MPWAKQNSLVTQVLKSSAVKAIVLQIPAQIQAICVSCCLNIKTAFPKLWLCEKSLTVSSDHMYGSSHINLAHKLELDSGCKVLISDLSLNHLINHLIT